MFSPALGVKPDCAALNSKAQPDFIHRAVHAADIYFVSNQKSIPETVDCAFRVTGRLPELWDAERGWIQPAPMWRVEDGRTIVTLDLEQAGSVFVVFRQPAAAPADPVIKSRVHPTTYRASAVEIRKAVYGVFTQPDGGRVDVTAKLAEKVKDDELRCWLPMILPAIPRTMVVKELRVEYALRRRCRVDRGRRRANTASCHPRK